MVTKSQGDKTLPVFPLSPLRHSLFPLILKTSIKNCISLFDSTVSYKTRDFLAKAQKEGKIINATMDLPKSFIICREKDEDKIYICQLSPMTLIKRTDKSKGYSGKE